MTRARSMAEALDQREKSLFKTVMHFSESSGRDLFVYAHTVNGRTVISASRTNPFPPGQPEATREVRIRRPQTAEMKAAQEASMAILAQRCRGYEASTEGRVWPEAVVIHPGTTETRKSA